MLSRIDGSIRLATYRHFVQSGVAPSVADIARVTGESASEVRASWNRLADAHVLVLDDSEALRMAMPLSAVSTGMRVRCGGRAYFANCAWDALGVPAMLGTDAAIEADDPLGGTPLRVRIEDGILDRDDLLVHFAVRAAEWWTDIGYT